MSSASDRTALLKYKCLAADKWSRYPATQDVDMACYSIENLESETFCDGTYIGPGASFDITSTQDIVITSSVGDVITQSPLFPQSGLKDAFGSTGNAGEVLKKNNTNQLYWGTGTTYETVSITDGSLNPITDVSIITSAGNHILGTTGVTPYQEKTIINARDPVYTSFFKHSYAGVINAGGFITSGRVWKIIPKPAPSTQVFVLGTFTQDITGNTNGKCIFKYDTATYAYTQLGSGITPQTASPAQIWYGAVDGYWDNNTQRLYVTGMFTSAGGVANTTGVAYWDEGASSWNAMGTGLSSTNRGGTCMTPKLDGSGNLLGLYVGGEFNSAGGVANTLRITFWDGTSWNALGSGVTGGEVRRIYYSSTLNRLYLSGSFTAATPSSTGTIGDCTYFCYYDFGANIYNPLSTPAGINFNATCNDFYLDEVTEDVYLAGSFTQTRTTGIATNGLAKWINNTGTWSLWGASFSTQPIIGSGGQNGYKVLKTSTNKLFVLNTGTSQPTTILGRHYNYMNSRQYNNLAVWDLSASTPDWDIIANGYNDSVVNAFEFAPNEYVFCGSGAGEQGMVPLTYGSSGGYIFKPDNATAIVFDKIAQGGTNQFMPIVGSPPNSVRCYLTVPNQTVKLIYDPIMGCWSTMRGLNSGNLLANAFSSYWSP